MLKTKTKKKNSKIKSNKKSNRGVVTSISKKKKKVAKKLKTSNKKVIKKNKLRIVTISETPIIESSKKTKKTRKPKDKMYFTSETEEAINQYNQSQEQSERDEIYNSKIKYAFEKLVENVFNTFKFCYFETGPIEVQKETIAHLVANIHKFESGKGKAFSYFSIIAKNYLIFQNNTNYKRFNQHVEISDDTNENTYKLQQDDPHYKEEENREFISMMVSYWENNVNKIFTKQRDINIANAVIELFRNSDRIDAFNKKALYLYIREISSCKTQQITKVINRMKNYQNNITKSYVKNGIL
jgi:hypothetical protein